MDSATTPDGEQRASGDDALGALTEELRSALAPGILLLNQIAEGGMGTVFLARDPALKRLVVVKVLSPDFARDAKARTRFAREAEAAAAVAHPNVVGIYQVGQLPRSGTSYIVMQYVDGPTLAEEFPEGTVLPLSRAKRIIGGIATALAAAHARGLVHRDIKPSNVMLERESDRVLVLDFGITAAVGPRDSAAATRLTAEGTYIGTPQYMSPEQALGEEVTDRSDVYSLGIVAFELLTGQPVFAEERTPVAMAAAHIHRLPPKVAALRPDLDTALADLIDRCLSKDPAQRPSALEIAKMLVPAAHPLVEWPPPGLERLHGQGWRLTRLATRVAAGAIALFALLYLQPALTTGAWPSGESSWFWRLVWAPAFSLDSIFLRPIECDIRAGLNERCPPSVVDAGPLWLFALTVVSLLVIAGASRVVRVGVNLVRLMRAGGRAGYPWQAMADVAWDAGPDTEALLNGAGQYVAVGDAQRGELLRRQRAAVAWLTAWTLVAALLPGLWLLGGAVFGDAGAKWLTLPELLVVTLPLAVGLLGRQTLLIEERRVRARGRREASTRSLAAASVPRSLVEGWLQTGATVLGNDGGQWWRRPVFIVGSAVVAALLVAGSAGVIAAAAHPFAMWHAPTLRSWERAWLDMVGGEEGIAGRRSIRAWCGRWHGFIPLGVTPAASWAAPARGLTPRSAGPYGRWGATRIGCSRVSRATQCGPGSISHVRSPSPSRRGSRNSSACCADSCTRSEYARRPFSPWRPATVRRHGRGFARTSPRPGLRSWGWTPVRNFSASEPPSACTTRSPRRPETRRPLPRAWTCLTAFSGTSGRTPCLRSAR